jgi:hypothetical protein
LLKGFLIKGFLRFLAYFKQGAWRKKHLLLLCKLSPQNVVQKRWRYVFKQIPATMSQIIRLFFGAEV